MNSGVLHADSLAPRALVAELDPRLRVVAAVIFAVLVVALEHSVTLVVALGLSVALLGVSGLAVAQTLRRMAAMDGFILFTLVLLPFTTPGTELFSLFGMEASREGLFHAVQIALTANAAILALMVLVGSMEPVTLGHALHALRLPERLVQLILFTIRYIDVLRAEYLRMRAAMKLRGFRAGTNWHTYRSYGYLVGMMLVRAIERSERILDAIKCRGFQGRFPVLTAFRLTRRDGVFAGLALVAFAALIGLEIILGAA